MKLSKRQFCDAVTVFEKMYREENEIFNILNISPEWVCGEWIHQFYDFLSDVCDLEEDPKYGTTLDWFCFEADFGKAQDNKIYVDGKTWTINSPSILYDYIMEVEKEEY